MKRWKQFLTLLLIIGLALGIGSFERFGIKGSVIPFSEGKEGMSVSEEPDTDVAEIPLEEVESITEFETSTIVLTEEKEPASEEKQVQHTEASSAFSEGHSFSAGNEKQEPKEPVGSGQDSQTQKEPAATPANGTEPEKGQDPVEDKTETAPEHVHSWVEEIIRHDAITHIEHHEAVTEDRWVSVPVKINHFICNKCHKEFLTQEEVYAHEDASYEAAIEANDMSLIHSGHTIIPETVDQGYYETVVVREAYDETVIDQPAWEEHIIRCSECGETR